MKLAAKYGLPIICLIDTPGAYPGIGAEERGQAQVIAQNMFEMSRLPTPIICAVIGEGGSGGALGIGVGDRVAMLEHAYYSVISPEGFAGILWKSASYAEQAAKALRMTSKDLSRFRVIDDVIEEPLGGAHRDHHQMASRLKIYLLKCLRELVGVPRDHWWKNGTTSSAGWASFWNRLCPTPPACRRGQSTPAPTNGRRPGARWICRS